MKYYTGTQNQYTWNVKYVSSTVTTESPKEVTYYLRIRHLEYIDKEKSKFKVKNIKIL